MIMSPLFLVVLFIICNILFSFGYTGNEYMIGTGKWKIHHVNFEKSDLDEIKIDLTQHRFDRSTYVFSGTISALKDVNDQYAARLNILKEMDGGFKQFQQINENSIVTFAYKYAKDNIIEALKVLGIVPPELPLPAGVHKLKDFKFDVRGLPKNFTYGHFIGELCIMKGSMGITAGCLISDIEFYEEEDEENADDDEEADD